MPGQIRVQTNLKGAENECFKAKSSFMFHIFRSVTALLTLTALLTSTVFTVSSAAQKGKSDPQKNVLTEEQRISHVLNRLGFGARPGDVERVQGDWHSEIHRATTQSVANLR